ncbi:hypothetical protein [Halobacterium noricense]|uniref:hypothetical protein n=1 Tax=Halobacterium noricense TaxID=223182 RepID=UPI001E514C5A|nr:hypothetical protein [Halobacterium noricense]UHH25596.1 hypothetical protein LT974_01315 [Halobacterium noricense]
MVDVETKRRLAKSWLTENVHGVGDTIAQKIVDKYVHEDTETLLDALLDIDFDIDNVPSGTYSDITHEIVRITEDDPIAHVTDVDLLYAKHLGIRMAYITDPDEEDWEQIEDDDLHLVYASEEGESIHTAHNI